MADIAELILADHARIRRLLAEIGNRLAEGSYGKHNRQAIAAREARIADRLRAVEQAHRFAIQRDAVPGQPEAATPLRPAGHMIDREIETE